MSAHIEARPPTGDDYAPPSGEDLAADGEPLSSAATFVMKLSSSKQGLPTQFISSSLVTGLAAVGLPNLAELANADFPSKSSAADGGTDAGGLGAGAKVLGAVSTGGVADLDADADAKDLRAGGAGKGAGANPEADGGLGAHAVGADAAAGASGFCGTRGAAAAVGEGISNEPDGMTSHPSCRLLSSLGGSADRRSIASSSSAETTLPPF